jgi:hypothetical protein
LDYREIVISVVIPFEARRYGSAFEEVVKEIVAFDFFFAAGYCCGH